MKKSGFTLVEMVIVIAVIGILAAVMIPTFGGARASGYDAGAVHCAEQLKTAQTAYYVSSRTFAGSVSALDPSLIPACQAVQVGTSAADVSASGNGSFTTTASSFSTLAWSQKGRKVFTVSSSGGVVAR